MKWLRYATDAGPRYGRLVGDTEIEPVTGTPFGDAKADGPRISLASVRLLAPVAVRRVFGVGLNYVNHIMETGSKTPRIPMLFMKPDSAIVGPEEPVVYPLEGKNVHYEAELAVVIGRRARRVAAADAASVILGYTCANDISERVIQREEMDMGALVIGKGFDTFCPLGPVIVTELDPSSLRIIARVNGVTKQDSNTSDLLFDVPTLVSYLSQSITLEPGDVIITGTPAGIGPVVPGDVMEIEVEGIGVLRNPVVAEGTAAAKFDQ
jgi:2-keto-4-pentenoate hydratase/2-oxohepta-3-ene-1,7-dioic acid hydratase in catechol pathway